MVTARLRPELADLPAYTPGKTVPGAIKIASTYTASRWQVADMLANRDNPEWVTHFRKTHAEALRDASLRCARHFTALRPPLSASPSGFAVACCRGRASLLPPLSSDGSRTDRAPLVVPRLVDNSHPYHPLMGSLPNIRIERPFSPWIMPQ